MRNVSLHKKLLTAILGLSQIATLFAQDGFIKGTVTNGHLNLPGATVIVGTEMRLTGVNGEFSFSLKAGNYTLIITHAGYKTIEKPVSVTAGATQTFNYSMTPSEQLGEVVVLGSRFIQRSNLNTPVPVDVFSSGRLAETGHISLTQILSFLAPSFNASREILNEPATLRGLDPQHVLILINGIRYHNMAWLFAGGLKGQLGRGSVGNDLNSIPFPAIEKIEILRDGASAQYGSDAIAGVINIQLKKTSGKTSIQLHTGQFYKGDGEKFSIGINRGFSLNKKGFLNFSASYRYQAPTFRGGKYLGTVYYDTTNKTNSQKDSLLVLDNQKILENDFNRQAAVDNAGNVKLISTGFSVNGGYSIGKYWEAAWTAIINNRKIERATAYRFPKSTSQVNFALYPNGFQAISKPNTVDVSLIAGARARTKNNWHWNFSSSYGINAVKSFVTNTNNASQSYLGTKAPTSFYLGRDVYKLLTNCINFTKQFIKVPGQMKAFNLAGGAEWRYENYHSMEGEKASWYNYDPANYPQAGVGAADTSYRVNRDRNIWGTYLELEAEFTDRFLFSMAGRHEYYSDFGGNLAAKLAARYKFSDKFSLRASANNGFRAPSLQQRYLKSIQTTMINSGGLRIPVMRGNFPNDHVVIKALRIPSLTAEKTINVSAGFTSTISNQLNLTVDAYWIQIKDRIVLSGILDRTIPAVRTILDSIPGMRVDVVQFFTNAINTRTKGIDIILDGNWNTGKATLGISLAANFNSTRLFGDIKTSDKLRADSANTNAIFNIEEKTRMEKGQPADKIILSLSYKKGKTKFMVTNTRFGKTAIAPVLKNPTRLPAESFSPKILTDISLSYSLRTWATLTLGANNIFDVYPDPLKNYDNTAQGIWIYSPEASAFGFNGGYYFLNMALSF